MLVIGLTGGLATGKTSVAKLFSRWGAKIIDADKIAHRLIAPSGACYSSILRVFGSEILLKGRIDRKRLASIVFEDTARLLRLEKIIHPAVVAEVVWQINKLKKENPLDVVVLDVPLLFEVGLERYCDMTVVVRSTQEIQIKRAREKFGITKIEALRRIKAQMRLSAKCRLAHFTIANTQNLNETKEQAKKIWKNILNGKK